jgi:transposase-like protein
LALGAAYGSEIYRRLGGEVKRKLSTWHVDEMKPSCASLPLDVPVQRCRHVGQTVDFWLSAMRDRKAAKIFLQKAMTNRTTDPARF